MGRNGRRFELLVGSGAFWERLSSDIQGATDRVWVQTLSLEGDVAGLGLEKALKACGAQDRRVLVDEFTRWVQNDRFLYGPEAMRDPELQAEVKETHRMISGLPAAGVRVRWSSPLGFLARRAAWRNHKKLVVIDERVCYLGGINFTEHNFQWHDLMLRIECPEATEFVARDFQRSWRGERSSGGRAFDGIELLTIDPPDISPYERVWTLLSQARKEIFVQSAYITPPLSDILGAAADRGAKVRILTPEHNNVALFQRYILWKANRHQFELRLLPGMTHMKAILIDGTTLLLGSANLHFMGHWTQNEHVVVVTDSGPVQDFIQRIREPDWERSRPFDGSVDRAGSLIHWWMKAYMYVAAGLGRGPVPPPREVTGS
jgi:cardiolipin synthase